MTVVGIQRGLVALLALLALAGAACSGGGDGLGGPGPSGQQEEDDDGGSGGEGCEIVTAADAEAILGEPVTPAEDGEEAGGQFAVAACNWEVDKETSFKLLQFSAYDGKQFYAGELFKDEPTFEKVDGVGDDAFFVETLGVQLQVLEGDTTLLIDVTGFNTEPPLDKERVKEQLIDLAKKVLAEL